MKRRLILLLLTPILVAWIAYLAWSPGIAPAADCLDATQLAQWSPQKQTFLPGGRAASGDVPVLFVHGITSGPSTWTRHEIKGGASIADRVAGVGGASVWAFDYSKWSLDWVTEPHIGPMLAKAIACLATLTGHRVILIDHSMGGGWPFSSQRHNETGAGLSQLISLRSSRSALHLKVRSC